MANARTSTELSEEEMDAIISGLKEVEDDDADTPLQIVGGSNVKVPSTIKVVDQEAIPIDRATARKMAKKEASKRDLLLKTIKNNPNNPESLDIVIEELAEEIFALKFERERLEQEEKDISNVAGRRVSAIKALIDTYLKKREINKDSALDLKSEEMEAVMRLIFAKIQETLKACGYQKEAVQGFFQTFQKLMENFEVEAHRAIDQNRSR